MRQVIGWFVVLLPFVLMLIITTYNSVKKIGWRDTMIALAIVVITVLWVTVGMIIITG